MPSGGARQVGAFAFHSDDSQVNANVVVLAIQRAAALALILFVGGIALGCRTVEINAPPAKAFEDKGILASSADVLFRGCEYVQVPHLGYDDKEP